MIYKNQRQRGKRGAGISVYRRSTSTIERVRGVKPLKMIRNPILDTVERGDFILFHHRLPTSTPNIPKCNHPICNETGTIHLIHNGWITSAHHHYIRLKNEGHTFETRIKRSYTIYRYGYSGFGYGEHYTDTESLVHELEDNLQRSGNDCIKAIEMTVANVEGSLAFAFFIRGDPTIYVYRGDNPCVVYSDSKENVWFSSEFPLKKRFRIIKDLQEGDIATIDENGFERIKRLRYLSLESRIVYQTLDYADLERDIEDYAELIENVREKISWDYSYLKRGISIKQIAMLVRDEMFYSGIKAKRSIIYALAEEIWESL